jgi:pimeloyl-ACP methyl ester carboxylesterase
MAKIYFKNKDGLKLVGILSKSKAKNKTCIILCHGITADKEEDGIFTELAGKLSEAGFDVFRFDFRGHGESEGKSIDMTVSGEERDLEAAYKLLVDNGYARFGIVAASFAGGAASFFTPKHQDRVKALVLWNSVIDYTALIPRWLATSGGEEKLKNQGFIVRNRFRIGRKLFDEMSKLKPWKKLEKLSMPILFIHGDRDSKVPYSDSAKYAKMLNARLETIKGGEHGFHDDKRHSDQADKITINFFLENLT